MSAAREVALEAMERQAEAVLRDAANLYAEAVDCGGEFHIGSWLESVGYQVVPASSVLPEDGEVVQVYSAPTSPTPGEVGLTPGHARCALAYLPPEAFPSPTVHATRAALRRIADGVPQEQVIELGEGVTGAIGPEISGGPGDKVLDREIARLEEADEKGQLTEFGRGGLVQLLRVRDEIVRAGQTDREPGDVALIAASELSVLLLRSDVTPPVAGEIQRIANSLRAYAPPPGVREGREECWAPADVVDLEVPADRGGVPVDSNERRSADEATDPGDREAQEPRRICRRCAQRYTGDVPVRDCVVCGGEVL